MNQSNSFVCGNCGSSNQIDAHFCQNCGQKLAKNCPRCGTGNNNDVKFCISCGFDFSSTYCGLTRNRRKEWHRHFMSFPGYAANFEEFLVENREALAILDQKWPDRIGRGSGNALGLLIKPRRNWCINKLTWNGVGISNGYLGVGGTVLAVWDINHEKDYRILFSNLAKASFKNTTFTLSGSDDDMVQFSIKTNRPGAGTLLVQLADTLGSIFYSDNPSVDSQRLSAQSDEVIQRQEASDAFVGNIFNLFAEILRQ